MRMTADPDPHRSVVWRRCGWGGCPTWSTPRVPPPITKATLHSNWMSFQPPTPPLPDGISADTICPRRIELDKILVDAAVEAGAELREGFPVRELLWDGDTVMGVRAGPRGSEEDLAARIVIGADGLHSIIARMV